MLEIAREQGPRSQCDPTRPARWAATVTAPVDVVSTFVAKLELSLWHLRSHTSGVARSSPSVPLVATDRSEEAARSGRLDDWGTFHLHGVGCLIELGTGEEVDVGWDTEGRPVFDGWRLRRFARSAGEEWLSQEALVEAARQLVANGVLDETPDGWFRLPGRTMP